MEDIDILISRYGPPTSQFPLLVAAVSSSRISKSLSRRTDSAMRQVRFVLLLAVAIVSGASRARADIAPAFVTSWGDSGTANGQFNSPVDIATDSHGNVYVTDLKNHRVQKFDSNGTFLLKWGTNGSGNGQFVYPVGIALDAQDNVYVVDSGNNRIEKFSTSGAFLGKWGSAGGGAGQFWNPQGVTVSGNGTIYVADTFNDRIQKFTSGGAYLLTWGYNGSAPGQFTYPTGIATDSQGGVYVADLFNDRVEKFSSDSTLVTTWGSLGSGVGQFKNAFDLAVDRADKVYVADGGNHRIGVGQFKNAFDLAVDKADKVYVADGGNHRIEKFDADGAFILTWGTYGRVNGKLRFPESLTVVGQDTFYVADTGNFRIQKFVTPPNPVTLSYLTAERSGGTVVIRWEVNDFVHDQVAFSVYRGNIEVTQAVLRGQRHYTFVDEHAPRDATTYWLEEVDADGTSLRHGPIEVGAAPALPLELTAFPNPFKPETTLRYTVPTESQVSLAVYTVSGERVAMLLDRETRQPDQYEYRYRSTLPSGVYFVRLTVGKKSTTEKIVVVP